MGILSESTAWHKGNQSPVIGDGSGFHVLGDGHGDSDMDILAGKDVLQILCSDIGKNKKQAGMTKSCNTLLRLYSESEVQENTIATTSTTTSTKPLHHLPTATSSPRKQRKSYKPSRVPPSEVDASLPAVDKSTITDDHDSVRMMMNSGSAITHDDSIMMMMKNSAIQHDDSMMMQKKLEDSTTMLVNSAITHDDSMMMMKKSSSNIMHDDDLMVLKATKGKRKKRRDSFCTTTVCKNLACKAVLHPGASFCRRCSCYICRGFDDNKDPSLWIMCSLEDQDGKESCGLSCHVECALQGEVAGVIFNGGTISLDGSYCCQPCGKISSLIGFWKKQLLVVKDARRVDILCHRLLLSHRLLNGTVRYKDAHGFIDEAVKKLEAEVRLMTKGSAKLARCIVNRLSCNVEVQKLISLALETVENLSSDAPSTAGNAKNAVMHNGTSCTMRFEDVCSSSMVVVAVDDHPCNGKLGYKLWHRRATDPSYSAAPTCTIQSTSKKALVSDLQPLTVYAFRLLSFSSGGDGGQCEAECCTKGMESVVVLERRVREENSDCVLGVSGINGGNQDEPRALQNQQCYASIANDGASHSIESQCTHKEGAKALQNQQCYASIANDGASHSIESQCTHKEGAKAHRGEEDLNNTKTSSTLEVHEGRDNQSTEGPSDVPAGLADTNEGIVSTRKDTCETLEPLRVTHPASTELEKANEEVIILNKRDSFDHRPPKDSSANVMDGNAPFQSWAMQVHCKEINASAQTTVQGVERDLAHMNGTIDCCSKADSREFELSIKVIRWLECLGHLKEEFRRKFLTWYSLRATEHEKRVVSVFIDTLQDSPASLAGQLVDAFQDIVTSKRQRTTEDGYYSRLC